MTLLARIFFMDNTTSVCAALRADVGHVYRIATALLFNF
jgi:hypothetical protein